jgi:threonine/homoserine/homoserine lactone efflux protein
MAPGPLLTYTIIKSMKSKKGHLMGIFIILGHAILEFGILILILFGFSAFFKNITVIRIIAVGGCLLLQYFGIKLIRDLYKQKIPVNFLSSEKGENKMSALPVTQAKSKSTIIDNPILGGIFVSASNPYWWIWWATAGVSTMIDYDVTLSNWPAVIAFFVGHELGDLSWYLVVSVMAFLGKKRINKQLYYGVLGICGLFMVIYGLYLGISPFFR